MTTGSKFLGCGNIGEGMGMMIDFHTQYLHYLHFFPNSRQLKNLVERQWIGVSRADRI